MQLKYFFNIVIFYYIFFNLEIEIINCKYYISLFKNFIRFSITKVERDLNENKK